MTRLSHFFLLGFWLACPASLLAQAPRRPELAGRWSLDYFASTRPGGETLAFAGGTISPQNLMFAARHEEFTVGDDGKFQWLERKNGQWHSDARLIVGGQSSHPTQTNEPLLKAAGEIDRERKLTLTLLWSHGSGPFTSGDGRPGSLSVSEDGGIVTVYFQGNTSSHASQFLTVAWTLEPKITVRDIGPDQQEERAVYSASRRRTLSEFGAGPLPVTERIRVEQVRQLKLVPRG